MSLKGREARSRRRGRTGLAGRERPGRDGTRGAGPGYGGRRPGWQAGRRRWHM